MTGSERSSAPILRVTDKVLPEEEAAVLAGLSAYNNEVLLGPTDRRSIGVLLRNDDGSVDGGLIGYTGRGWLYVSMLFVPERLRGQGLAGSLLQTAEDEAKARGCRGAYIDTINPIARRAYERQGYDVFGTLDDFYRGLALTWLRKLF